MSDISIIHKLEAQTHPQDILRSWIPGQQFRFKIRILFRLIFLQGVIAMNYIGAVQIDTVCIPEIFMTPALHFSDTPLG